MTDDVAQLGLTVVNDAALQPLNTFGVVANAKQLIQLNCETALAELHKKLAGRTPKLLGGGSNLVITKDVVAPIVHILLRGIRLVDRTENTVIIEAASGEPWHPFVRHCLEQGWFGLENLSLIPGNVGASPIQNIGAYGQEVAASITSLRAWHVITGETRTWSNQECQFAYRDSAFKQGDGANWIILSVRFALSLVPKPQYRYADLKAHLAAAQITNPSPIQISDAVCQIRSSKLPDPKQLGNAGSFFKNPLVDSSLAAQIQLANPSAPIYDQADGAVKKLSAGWLIDQCGWKGKRIGDAGVHKDHALVLVNYGHASGVEILALANKIQASVQERFNVRLESEPVTW